MGHNLSLMFVIMPRAKPSGLLSSVLSSNSRVKGLALADIIKTISLILCGAKVDIGSHCTSVKECLNINEKQKYSGFTTQSGQSIKIRHVAVSHFHLSLMFVIKPRAKPSGLLSPAPSY